MGRVNNFRLSYETAFLFVLSNEYNLPLAKLLAMYNLSDKIFWNYLAIFAPMSKMGVRKSSQLSKMANRLFKLLRNLPDKKRKKIEEDVFDDEGNPVMDERTGKPKKQKRVVIEYFPIEPTSEERSLMNTMKYFTTKGYSNGDTFLDIDEIVKLAVRVPTDSDTITYEGEKYLLCTKIEHILEKYFPDISIPEFRGYSAKTISDLLEGLSKKEALVGA